MKLGVCVPYRNRKLHLTKLIKNLGKYLSSKNIEYKFYIAHQVDKKLFNRGAMKNIAAKRAFEDGCDYIAWHDVDMIPADDSPDYSCPKKYPIHIATNLSKFNGGMRYEQYFGGVVLFTREQVEKVNGYSNEYWDWGQEDDDLFWRCYNENMVDVQKLVEYDYIKVAKFDGKKSYMSVKVDRDLQAILNGSHTISLLVKPEHDKKYPQYLIGDENKKFIEYPMLRKKELNGWGVSFNNSNAISFMCKDIKNNTYYNWGKRDEKIWTWVTLSYRKEDSLIYFLINNDLVFLDKDENNNKLISLQNKLKYFRKNDTLLFGVDNNTNIFYKGNIAAIRIHDNFISDVENSSPKYYWDGNNPTKFGNLSMKRNSIKFNYEKIDVIQSILPFRRNGKYTCMPHKDEGFLNGEWIKKNTTSKNEKKLAKKLKSKKFPYKKDGINSVKYKIKSIENIDNFTEIINVSL